MHIAPFDNHNQPIIGIDNPTTPLCYFNIVHLKRGETFLSTTPGYETAIVPATGTIDVTTAGETFQHIGQRRQNVWDGEPEGVYVPTSAPATITCTSDTAEIFISGARFSETLKPFAVRAADIDLVQYGSDDTKTHRKIKHILGTKYHGRVGRLLVSELFTVGAGGWSGFPSHKHDTTRLPMETRHDEVYNFRFNPPHGGGLQMLQREDGKPGDAYHIVDGSTIAIDKGYHPCCALPGYEMYYFTILAGETQRSLVQYFQPTHAYQIETIPGIKDMIAKFKMTRATLRDVLTPCLTDGTAVAGLVVLGWEDALAYTRAAEAETRPLILQAGPGARAHTPLPILGAMFRHLADTASVPVVAHLDHGESLAVCAEAIACGFTSVMFDGSALPLAENIAKTAEIAQMAHAAGVCIEAELGHVGYPDRPSHGTDPSEVAQFLNETNIDALAISIGNSHLMTTKDAQIDLVQLKAIQSAAPSLPLVLHGGSGLAPALRRQLARDTTIAKFNIGTELRQAFGTALRQTLADHPERFDRIQILRETIDPVSQAARQIIANLA